MTFFRHNHLRFDTKLVQVQYEIRHIICAFNACNDKLDFQCNSRLRNNTQQSYQILKHCVHSDVLGESNIWNIIAMKHKDTDEKEFENMHKIL